jgi:hypothetical protein
MEQGEGSAQLMEEDEQAPDGVQAGGLGTSPDWKAALDAVVPAVVVLKVVGTCAPWALPGYEGEHLAC